jgi:hypothetical protein
MSEKEHSPELSYRQDLVRKATSLIDDFTARASEEYYQMLPPERLNQELSKSERVLSAFVHDKSSYWLLKKEQKDQDDTQLARTYYSMKLLNPSVDSIQIDITFSQEEGGYILNGHVSREKPTVNKLITDVKHLEQWVNNLEESTLVDNEEGEEKLEEFAKAHAKNLHPSNRKNKGLKKGFIKLFGTEETDTDK